MAFADAQTGGRVVDAWGRTTVTLAGTVTLGDILGYSSGWKRALATVGSVVQGAIVALQDGVSGDVINVARGAVIDGRFSGGTAGNLIYVAEGSSNGQYTETVPSTTNDATTIMGMMMTASCAIVSPRQSAVTLSS